MGERLFFDSRYYKTLWTIISMDKRNRKVILDFINSMPVSVYKQILKSLEDYKNNKIGYEIQKKVNNIIYYFRIDSSDNSICLGQFWNKKRLDNNIFMIKLYPYIETFNMDDEILLGNLIYQKRDLDNIHIWDCDKVQYSLIQKTKGLFFVRFCDYELLFPKIFRKVDEDLFLNISSEESIYIDEQRLLNKKRSRKKFYNKKNICQ